MYYLDKNLQYLQKHVSTRYFITMTITLPYKREDIKRMFMLDSSYTMDDVIELAIITRDNYEHFIEWIYDVIRLSYNDLYVFKDLVDFAFEYNLSWKTLGQFYKECGSREPGPRGETWFVYPVFHIVISNDNPWHVHYVELLNKQTTRYYVCTIPVMHRTDPDIICTRNLGCTAPPPSPFRLSYSYSAPFTNKTVKLYSPLVSENIILSQRDIFGSLKFKKVNRIFILFWRCFGKVF